MKLLFFCPIWGMMDLPLRMALTRIKNAGYDGVEYACQLNEGKREEFLAICKELDLLFIVQQYGASGKTYEDYVESFNEHLIYLTSFRPLFVNSQTGKDYFRMKQNLRLIHHAREIEDNTGIPIVHETHRGKFSFSAFTTTSYIEQYPSLQLTADFSHFCNVSESFLEDQAHVLEKIIPSVMHIHARVGHPQGPQVTDPRLPEWKIALEHHLKWWTMIIKHHQSVGSDVLTITPEFGPKPYMPAIPFTQEPIASQWDINLFMRDFLKSHAASLGIV